MLADLRGIDRIEYRSYKELKKHLSKLMRNQFGAPTAEQEPETGALVAQLDALRARIPTVLKDEPGQQIGALASTLGVPIELAQTLVRPLLNAQELETSGVRRGTRYYVSGDPPP